MPCRHNYFILDPQTRLLCTKFSLRLIYFPCVTFAFHGLLHHSHLKILSPPIRQRWTIRLNRLDVIKVNQINSFAFHSCLLCVSFASHFPFALLFSLICVSSAFRGQVGLNNPFHLHPGCVASIGVDKTEPRALARPRLAWEGF